MRPAHHHVHVPVSGDTDAMAADREDQAISDACDLEPSCPSGADFDNV